MNKILLMSFLYVTSSLAMAGELPKGLSFDANKRTLLASHGKQDEGYVLEPIGKADAVIVIKKSKVVWSGSNYMFKTEDICREHRQIGIFDARDRGGNINNLEATVICPTTLNGQAAKVQVFPSIMYFRSYYDSDMIPKGDSKSLIAISGVYPVTGEDQKVPIFQYLTAGTKDLQQKSFYTFMPANHGMVCDLRNGNSSDCTFSQLESFQVYVEVQE